MKQVFTLCCILCSLAVYAQNAEISGKITDINTKEPISGAAVRYDRGKSTITDISGQYKLTLEVGQYEITISSIGYKKDKQTITVTAGEKKIIDVQLTPDAFEFNEITTVSQYKKNAAKENVSTSVITAEQIKHTNSNDLGEALNKTSGVLVQDGQITIRSGSSYSYGVGSRTAIMQDGLSLMSADLGQGQNNMAELSNTKQVEVVKGASSVIYGSSALNGVINIVTDWPTEDTPRTTLDVNIGVYGNTPLAYQQWWSNALPFFYNISANHRRKIKNVQFMIGGNMTGVNSYLQANNDWRAQVFFKTRFISPKIEGLSYGINGSFQYETIDEFFIAKDADSSAFKIGAGSSSRYVRLNIDPHLTYSHRKGHTYKLTMRYMNIDRLGNGTDPNAISHQLMMENQYQYKWKGMIVLTAGLPFNVGRSSSNLYNDHHVTLNAGGYTQLEINYKKLSIQGGIRYEVQKVDNDLEKSKPVFRTGLNYQAGKASFIRASWGQAYRIPTIGERDILQNFYPGVVVIPNDTLHAESGWSAEIGFNQGFKIGKNFLGFVDLAFYYNQYNEFTQYDFGGFQNRFPGSGRPITTDSAFLNNISIPVKPALSIPISNLKLFGIQAHNIENARIFGYELTAGGRGNIGKVGITFSAGYSYNYGSALPRAGSSDPYSTGNFLSDAFRYNFKRISDTSSAAYHHLLEYRVRHLIRLDLELKYWRCYLGTTISYASFPEVIPPTIELATDVIAGNQSYHVFYAQHSGGDVIADIRAGYKVNKHFDMGFIVKNLANRFYMLRPGRPEPIRNYTLQFRYNF